MVTLAILLATASVPADEAMRVPVTSRDLVEVAEISGVTVSPDGQRVAYRVSRPSSEENETRLDWYVVDARDGVPVHIGSGGLARHNGAGVVAQQAPVWDRDSRGLRFTALADGIVAIWHWREGDPAQREIVDRADIIDFAVSPDGRSLRYTVGATRAEIAAAQRQAYENGVLVDDTLDLGQAIAGGMIVGGKRVMQRFSSEWFEKKALLWDTPRRTKIVALGAARDAAGPAEAAAPLGPPRVNQGRKVAGDDGSVFELAAEDGTSLVTATRPNGVRLVCDAEACRSPGLAAIAARPGHDMLILFERAGTSREKVWLWEPGKGEPRLLAITDGDVRSPALLPRCVAAARALACIHGAPAVPPKLVSYDYDSGAMSTLADPNAELRRRIVADVEPMAWANGHRGVLLRPLSTPEPLPLVIQYSYCGGFLKGGVGDEIPILPLLEHGIAVLCMDRVRPPKDAAMDEVYRIALTAIEQAIGDLGAAGVVDTRRVGIGGLSFGSQVAMWSIRHSDRFAAATISSGQVTPHYYWNNAVPDRGFADMFTQWWKAGDPDSDPERWHVLSPVYNIASFDTPLLMQLPESEVRNIIELHTKLKRAGKPVELFAFADEVHIKYQPAHKRAVYERNLDWYRFWLIGDEDLDPAKAEQYTRWRDLLATRPSRSGSSDLGDAN